MPAYRVQVEFTGLSGSPYLATHYIDQASAASPDVAVTAVGQFWGAIDGFLNSGLAWATLPEVPQYDSPSQVTEVNVRPTVTGGGGTNDVELPTATQALIRWRTNVFNGNRRVLGKTFVPGVTINALNTNGRPNAQLLLVLNDAAAALSAAGLVVASRALDVFAPTIGGDAWPEFAVLRSRRD